MDDYLSMLLLSITVIVAYLSVSVEMAFKLIDETNLLDLSDNNRKRFSFLFHKKDFVKLSFVMLNILLSSTIAVLIAITNINGDFSLEETTLNMITAGRIINIALWMSAVSLVFMYLLPSLTVSRFHGRIINYAFWPVSIIVYAFYPITYLMLIIRKALYVNSVDINDKPITIEELSDAVEIVSMVNTPEEKRILDGMIKFANADVEDVMCHRTNVIAVEYSESFESVKAIFIDSGFSRLPVYCESWENIVGVLYLKDLIGDIETPLFDWHTVIRKPLFARDSQKVNELLLIFQAKKEHIAIVTDEYGSTIGIVTLEDLLEEIVGEINDEFDQDEDNNCTKSDDGTYIVEGKMPISDFAEMLALDEEEIELVSEDIDTVAGLVVELLHDFPRTGSAVDFKTVYRLTVISMDRYRIDKIEVKPIVKQKKDKVDSNEDK